MWCSQMFIAFSHISTYWSVHTNLTLFFQYLFLLQHLCFDVELRNLWLNDKEGNNLLFLACWGILQSRWVRNTRCVGCDLLPVEQLWIVQPVIMRCCKQLLLSLWHCSHFKTKVLTKLCKKQSNYFYVMKIMIVNMYLLRWLGNAYIYWKNMYILKNITYMCVKCILKLNVLSMFVYTYTPCYIGIFNKNTCSGIAAILYHPNNQFFILLKF